MKLKYSMMALLFVASQLLLPVIGRTDEPKPPKMDPEERIEKRVERLTKELLLSPDQKAQVEAALKESHEKMKAFHEEMKAKMKSLQEEADGKISAVLNDQQRTRYTEMKRWDPLESTCRHASLSIL